MATIAQVPKNLESELVLLNVKTGKEKVILREKRHFEAPNWSRDGKFLIVNSNGKLEKISVKGKKLWQAFDATSKVIKFEKLIL